MARSSGVERMQLVPCRKVKVTLLVRLASSHGQQMRDSIVAE
jgi:hypothetical protein